VSELGIAVYSGLNQSVEQNLNYLALARQCGYSRLFTSLHIPESDAEGLVQDTRQMLTCAAELGFVITTDISPATWQQFDITPEQLKNMGIATIRIDYGINPAEMKILSDAANVALEVNASVLTEAEMSALFSAGFSANCLSACHNYYPRPETGLSFSLFIERTRFFFRHNIPVGAFIPSLQTSRGPIFAGLPTVEEHRRMSPVEAARQLWASGMIDRIIWGDPLVSEPELRAVASLPKTLDSVVTMRLIVEPETMSVQERSMVFLPGHTNRRDAAALVIRSQESRSLCRQVSPRNANRKRNRGVVTIDNVNYGRYAGEMQIVLQDLPADDRVNVVGRIVESDLCLLECILPGGRFCFKEVESL
jgi:hypothetical protein